MIARGAGTGSGTLNLEAERLASISGFGPFTQPAGVATFDRLALGFGTVNLESVGPGHGQPQGQPVRPPGAGRV